MGIQISSIKKQLLSFSKTESFKLLLLALLVIYAYWPYLTGFNLGADDAQWYQYALHDALDQFDKGFFPTYVGQGLFNYIGANLTRAPYYLLFGQLLHILTFKQLNSLYIQHLTIFFSAFLGAFFCYFLLTRLYPKLRWESLIIAFLYITCPGVIGIIYGCDMYYSFMTVSFLPLFIYGLIRSNQYSDFLSSLIIASSLSLLWMAHPPIALWASIICFIFYMVQLIFQKKGLYQIPIVGLLFVTLNLWQFVSVFSLGGGTEYAYIANTKKFIAELVQTSMDQMPGVFLPLGWDKKAVLPFLQLGYSLWICFLGGLIIAFNRRSSFLIKCLSTFIIILLALLYSPPKINIFFWSLMPKLILNITYSWPMERFYLILAALCCFVGAMALNTIYTNSHYRLKKSILCLLVILGCWNSYQAFYFITHYDTNRTNTSWLDSHNIFFFQQYLQRKTTEKINFAGAYNPILKNRLLNQEKNIIPAFDNEYILSKECALNTKSNNDITMASSALKLPIQFNSQPNNYVLQLFHLKVFPLKDYLLCVKVISSTQTITLQTIGAQYITLMYPFFTAPSQKKFTQNILLPFYIHNPQDSNLRVQLVVNPMNTAKIVSYGLIAYDTQALPINVNSFIPYQAQVNSSSSSNYLEIFKEYYPGYEATINGGKTSVLVSPNNLTMVPLVKGNNHVTLAYIGTPLMRASFYISSTAWIILLSYLAFIFYRQNTKTNRNKEN